MSDPFISEIRMIAFQFAPKGWATCSGQILAINQNTALFSLVGTMYGGNGVNTFALPDLRSRMPIHFSGQKPQGAIGGGETITLTTTTVTVTGDLPFGPTNYVASQPTTQFTSMSPYLVLNFCIALVGIFPARN